jgi:hypothetical protein
LFTFQSCDFVERILLNTRASNRNSLPNRAQSYHIRLYAEATKMNVNKKLDRFKQWAGERMGGEVKTNVSDDFKALEVEMGLRHEGS